MAMGLVTSWLERNHVGAQGPEWAFSFPERCLIAGRAAWFYAGKLFCPVNLTFIYPRWQLNVGAWWQWIFPVAALALVMVLWRLRRRIGRGPLVAVLFFGGTLLPALGFTNVYPMRYSFVADHFQYLASVGLIVLAVAGITMALGFLGKGNLLLKPVCYGALLLTLGVLTWRQCRMYSDIQTLWQATIDRNPACWMAHVHLGNALFNKGQTDEAMSQYQEAIRLKPDDADAHNNLGNVLDKNGQIDEAIDQYQKAIGLEPDDVEAHYNLGVALFNRGQTDEAISQLQEAIRLKPDYAEAQYNFGVALFNKDQTDEAISHLQEAIRLKSDYALAHNNLGIAFLKQGQTGEAMSQFQEAIRLKPDYADAHNNLGITLGMQDRINEAIIQFQEAIHLKPDFTNAQSNLMKALELRSKSNVRTSGPVKP
jgi:tetratricopeptide (TPR) repeat protein